MKKKKINVADAVRKIDHNWLIKNAMNLAKHHKKYCEGAKCNIALYGIAEAMAKQWSDFILSKKNTKEDGFPPTPKGMGIQPTIL